MIHRTYLAQMPSIAGTMPYLDILPQGPVGSPNAPVSRAQSPQPANQTAGPSGWQVFPNSVNGDGQFCEWRGRTLRFEKLFSAGVAGGFVPRLRLGWKLTALPASQLDGCLVAPTILYSKSLVGEPPSPFDVMVIADPSYGPAIRLLNTPDTEGGLYVVQLSVYDIKDEDREPSGV